MGKLAQLLNTTAPHKQDGRAHTTQVDGEHDSASLEGILGACGHDPSLVRFVAPPSVYTRWTAEGEKRTTYRYKLEPVPADPVEELIERVTTRAPHKRTRSTGGHWMVFQAGDQQISKRSRDGSTEQILERYYDSLQATVDEHKHLKRHGVEGIQISMPGDCIEGVVSQGGKNAWLTQETITEQVRILRRLMLHTVDALAPLADKVYLDVVGGNHDQAQRQWNTYPGDNWATECALAVKDAMQLNPKAYGHVDVRVPDKWSGSLTVPVGDTMVTVAHGHQWSRGKGLDWLKGQDFGRQDARGSQLLQHGHEHEWSMNTTRDVTRVCSPTYDMGSDWFRERAGGDSKRGGLVYLLKSGEVSRMSLV